jgi:exopolysaccharide production protein ExoZ
MTPRKEIIGLQYLRGLAAIAVVIYHAGAMAAFPKYFGQELLPDVLRYGSIGVDVFFLISGMIICIVAIDRDLLPRTSVGDFAMKRVVRILPMMWLAILSYAVLRVVGRSGVFDPLPYIRAATLFPAGELAPNVIWTLRHELCFYAVFAVAMLGFRRRLVWLLPLWFAAPIVYELAGLDLKPTDPWVEALRTIANPVNLEFAAGFALGAVWLRGSRSPLFILNGGAMLLLLIGMTVALVLITSAIGFEPHGTALNAAVTSALAATLLLVAIYGHPLAGPSRFVGVVLGDASYSIYLFHLHIVSAVLSVWSAMAPRTPIFVVVAMTALAAIVGGVVIHLLIERPLIAALQRRLAGKSRREGRGALPEAPRN